MRHAISDVAPVRAVPGVRSPARWAGATIRGPRRLRPDASGCSSAWQSASFGTKRSAVQIRAPRPSLPASRFGATRWTRARAARVLHLPRVRPGGRVLLALALLLSLRFAFLGIHRRVRGGSTAEREVREWADAVHQHHREPGPLAATAHLRCRPAHEVDQRACEQRRLRRADDRDRLARAPRQILSPVSPADVHPHQVHLHSDSLPRRVAQLRFHSDYDSVWIRSRT